MSLIYMYIYGSRRLQSDDNNFYTIVNYVKAGVNNNALGMRYDGDHIYWYNTEQYYKTINTLVTSKLITTPTYECGYIKTEWTDNEFALVQEYKHEVLEKRDFPNLTLFCHNWVDRSPTLRHKYYCYHITNLYHFSIKNAETKEKLVDIYPAMRKKDSKVGVFDTVRQKFYTTVNKTAFVAGDVIKPLYYPNNFLW